MPRVRLLQVSSGGVKTSAQSRRKSNTSSLGTSIITRNHSQKTVLPLVYFFFLFFSEGNVQSTTGHASIHLERNRKGAACLGGRQSWMVWLAGRPGLKLAGGGAAGCRDLSQIEVNKRTATHKHKGGDVGTREFPATQLGLTRPWSLLKNV